VENKKNEGGEHMKKKGEESATLKKKRISNFPHTYKKIQNGAVIKSYTVTNGLLICGDIRKPFLIYDCATAPL
jgi:hypothetical protein